MQMFSNLAIENKKHIRVPNRDVALYTQKRSWWHIENQAKNPNFFQNRKYIQPV